MFEYVRLDENRRLRRVNARRQPVDHHIPTVSADALRFVVVRRQRMPVGDEEKARMFVLQPNPVFQDTVIVAKMHCTRRAHAGENTIAEQHERQTKRRTIASPAARNGRSRKLSAPLTIKPMMMNSPNGSMRE